MEAERKKEKKKKRKPLRPKQLHHLYTWPSQGQTQVLQGSLRSNSGQQPQWTTHMQSWK